MMMGMTTPHEFHHIFRDDTFVDPDTGEVIETNVLLTEVLIDGASVGVVTAASRNVPDGMTLAGWQEQRKTMNEIALQRRIEAGQR